MYPVGRCAFARRFFVVWALVTMATLGLWAWQQEVSLVWSIGFVLSLVALRSGWQCVNVRDLELVWDGQAWYLSKVHGLASNLGKPAYITLDLQHTLLLQWMTLSKHDTIKIRWLWLSGSADPANWQNLRRALYSSEHLS